MHGGLALPLLLVDLSTRSLGYHRVTSFSGAADTVRQDGRAGLDKAIMNDANSSHFARLVFVHENDKSSPTHKEVRQHKKSREKEQALAQRAREKYRVAQRAAQRAAQRIAQRERRKRCRKNPCETWCAPLEEKRWEEKCTWGKTCCGCTQCTALWNSTEWRNRTRRGSLTYSPTSTSASSHRTISSQGHREHSAGPRTGEGSSKGHGKGTGGFDRQHGTSHGEWPAHPGIRESDDGTIPVRLTASELAAAAADTQPVRFGSGTLKSSQSATRSHDWRQHRRRAAYGAALVGLLFLVWAACATRQTVLSQGL